ncbi:MAG TPA: response regulator [Chitinophagaceae bacterium]|nr:response regulator [Chitinophagaceae bacterium]
MKDSLYHIDSSTQMKAPGDPVKKALIVDDEPDICYLLSNILRQANIQPVFAGSITEAEKILQSPNEFSYVFLDNCLPDGLGINQVKKWKSVYPSIHLIMITAHDSYQERNKAKGDGADHFISKPFSQELILNSIVQTPD